MLTAMKKLSFCCIAVCIAAASCRNDSKVQDWSSMNIQLNCEELEGSENSPSFAIYLQVEDRKTKIAEIGSTCNGITREEFESYEIPQTAIDAVGGWWAGAGDYFYTVAEGDVVAVYQGYADEMQEEPGYHYQRIATWDGKKFSVTQPSF